MTDQNSQAGNPAPAFVEALDGGMESGGFGDEKIPAPLIEEILQISSRSPSGVNSQPWQVYVARTNTLNEMSRRAEDALAALMGDKDREAGFATRLGEFDRQWLMPVLSARTSPQTSATISDKASDYFKFFGASTALVFTLSNKLGSGSLLDYGMFLQNVRLVARTRKLRTLRQTAWNALEEIVLQSVGASAEEMLVAVIAVGYDDAGRSSFEAPAVVMSAEQFATFLGP